jgi:putative solute:sodium symporter small subunit
MPRGPRFSARHELAERSALGAIYLRRLRHLQLALALVALVAFGGLIGALPLVLLVAPGLNDAEVLGVPLAIGLLVVPPFAAFVALGWLYARRADGLDEQFRDLIDEG